MKLYIDLLHMAQEGGYAVPAFNYSDIWEFAAIQEAAEELRAPVYAASAMITIDTLGLDYCAAIGAVGHQRAGGQLLNHLDHCKSVELCAMAVDAGYHSVMFDGSALDIEENIAFTREVVSYAHQKGAFVEGEVGRILGRSDEGNCNCGEAVVTIKDCMRMLEETGVDSLAIGIGNQHGFYANRPELNIGLLCEVGKMSGVPLVLHGSTGLDDSTVRQCVERGVCKVNVGTALHHAYKSAVRDCIEREPENFAIASFALPAKEAVKAVVKRWIVLCGAQNRR